MAQCKHERLEVDSTVTAAAPRRPVLGNAICADCKEPQPFLHIRDDIWIPVKGAVRAGFFPADEEGER